RILSHQRALEAHLQAQAALLTACGRRGAPSDDSRPRPMRADCLVQLLHAAALTGSALANLRTAPDESLALLPARPRLPDPGEHPPPPAKNPKTTSDGFSSEISRLSGSRRSGSSLAQRGRGTIE